MSEKAPRIVLYGTGQYGLEVARIATKKGWPIVAALNRAGDKVGRDLGQVAELGRDLGVIVQDCELADYGRIDADIAFVCTNRDRLKDNMSAYERLMNAGINVMCHSAGAYFPQATDPELGRRIDALAKRNNVSFSGGGIWDYSRIWPGILVAGPCTEIRSMFHRSLTDVQGASVHLMRACGVSLTPEAFAVQVADTLVGIYNIPPQLVMYGLGYEITKVTEHCEPMLADVPVYCRLLDRDLEPGICVGVRIVSTVETRQGVTALSHTELRIMSDDETTHMFWSVEGRPVSSIQVNRTENVHTSAASVVNRMRDVMAAAPGVHLLPDLGPMRPRLAA